RTISSHSTMLRAPPRTNGTKEEHRAILIGARPRVESGGPVRISGSGSSALRSKPRASVGAGEQKVCGLHGLEVRDRPFLEAARLGVDHAEREPEAFEAFEPVANRRSRADQVSWPELDDEAHLGVPLDGRARTRHRLQLSSLYVDL